MYSFSLNSERFCIIVQHFYYLVISYNRVWKLFHRFYYEKIQNVTINFFIKIKKYEWENIISIFIFIQKKKKTITKQNRQKKYAYKNIWMYRRIVI